MAANAVAAAGVNVTKIVHEPPAASDPPQVFVSAKSVGLAPPIEIPEIVNAAVPGFESFTDMAVAVEFTVVFGNESVVGESTACGVDVAMPVLVRNAAWGEPVALSATLRDALKPIADAGVKLTETLQLDPAASEVPQALVSAKSPALARAGGYRRACGTARTSGVDDRA